MGGADRGVRGMARAGARVSYNFDHVMQAALYFAAIGCFGLWLIGVLVLIGLATNPESYAKGVLAAVALVVWILFPLGLIP